MRGVVRLSDSTSALSHGRLDVQRIYAICARIDMKKRNDEWYIATYVAVRGVQRSTLEPPAERRTSWKLEDSFASLRWTKDRRICGTGFGTRRLLLRTGTKYRVNLYGVDVPYTTTATYK